MLCPQCGRESGARIDQCYRTGDRICIRIEAYRKGVEHGLEIAKKHARVVERRGKPVIDWTSVEKHQRDP